MKSYFITWDDTATYERLRVVAQARGEDVDDNDDWFEPQEIEKDTGVVTSLDTARSLAKKIAQTESFYGTADIYEKIAFDPETGTSDTVFVETVWAEPYEQLNKR